MVEIGQLAIKSAGRDAGRECLIVDKLKGDLVLIDGNTRRRKCSLKHLELQEPSAKIKKGAEHSEVLTALKSLGVGIIEKKAASYERKPRKGIGKKEKPAKAKKLRLFKGTKKSKLLGTKGKEKKKADTPKKSAKVKKEEKPKK